MTITLRGEEAGRTAHFEADARSYTRTFRLTTSLYTEGAAAVLVAGGLPGIGDSHPDDSLAYCYSKEASNDAPWAGWKVTCQYSTSARNIHATDPASDEVIISWSSDAWERAVWKDIDGRAIVNSAGDEFTEPAMQEQLILIAHISANVTSVPAWVLSYQNATNDAAITIGGLAIQVSQAKFHRLQISERKFRGSTEYYTVSFEIHIRAGGWDYEPIDAGFRFRNGAGELENIANEGDSQDPPEAVLLDGFGNVLLDPTPDTAVYMNYPLYEELDFSALPGIT